MSKNEFFMQREVGHFLSEFCIKGQARPAATGCGEGKANSHSG